MDLAVAGRVEQHPIVRGVTAAMRPPDWTWPHDRGHMWEVISPHLSRYEVGLEPACYHAMLRLTLSRHSA